MWTDICTCGTLEVRGQCRPGSLLILKTECSSAGIVCQGPLPDEPSLHVPQLPSSIFQFFAKILRHFSEIPSIFSVCKQKWNLVFTHVSS